MAQNKKTDPAEQFEQPDLTEQQLKFAIGVVYEGKTATDAWIAAYDASNMARNSIYVEASRALSHPKISLWIANARKSEMGKATRTLDQHIQRLDRLQQIALDTGNVGAAVQAEVSIGKAAGHYVEKHQDVGQTTDPVQTLREIAKTSPELAASLAAEHQIPWTADEGATKH